MGSGGNRPWWPDATPRRLGPYGRARQRLRSPAARRLRLLVAWLLLGAVALVALGAAVLFVSRTYSLGDATYPAGVRGVELDADGAGEIAAVESDRADVLVLWQRRYSLLRPRVERGLAAGTVRVHASCPAFSFRCAVILGAQVPKGTALAIRTRTAPASVAASTGPVELSSGSGAVEVRQASGPVRFDSASGRVSVLDLHGDLTGRSGAGQVLLQDVSGRVDVTTGSGAVTADGQVAPVFTVRSGSGWVTAAFAAPPGRVDVRSGSGAVTLTLPRGRYRFDLRAGAGRVHVDPGVVDDPAAARSVHVSAGADIVVEAR